MLEALDNGGGLRARIQYAAQTKTLPAPTGGWNARDNLAEMKETDAPIMDNMIPDTTKVILRNGFDPFCNTGTGTVVETLMPYSSGATNKFLAATGGAIYEISTGSASSLASGLTNNRWQYLNYNGYVVMVNGADHCRKYDGSTISLNAVTGLSSDASFIHINEFKKILFFTEKDSMRVYYLPSGSIAGSASMLDFSTLAKLGGYMVGMATWTRDGGSGPDDLACFITSKGEVIIYQGTDPSSSTTWTLVGVFQIGAPIGRRCFVKIGVDVVVLTLDGFFQLSRALPIARTEQQAALSDRISGAVQSATTAYASNFGWEAILYPNGRMGLFNIPIMAGSQQQQYVLNTNTDRWFRITGWNANTFALFNEDLYFGGNDGKIYLADSGPDDNGAAIVGDCQQAFSYYGTPMKKVFLAARPTIGGNGIVSPAMAMNIDYNNTAAFGTPTAVAGTGTQWDVGQWDTFQWAGDDLFAGTWLGVSGLGYAGAPRMRISDSVTTFAWAATEVMFKPASMM